MKINGKVNFFVFPEYPPGGVCCQRDWVIRTMSSHSSFNLIRYIALVEHIQTTYHASLSGAKHMLYINHQRRQCVSRTLWPYDVTHCWNTLRFCQFGHIFQWRLHENVDQ